MLVEVFQGGSAAHDNPQSPERGIRMADQHTLNMTQGRYPEAWRWYLFIQGPYGCHRQMPVEV